MDVSSPEPTKKWQAIAIVFLAGGGFIVMLALAIKNNWMVGFAIAGTLRAINDLLKRKFERPVIPWFRQENIFFALAFTLGALARYSWDWPDSNIKYFLLGIFALLAIELIIYAFMLDQKNESIRAAFTDYFKTAIPDEVMEKYQRRIRQWGIVAGITIVATGFMLKSIGISHGDIILSICIAIAVILFSLTALAPQELVIFTYLVGLHRSVSKLEHVEQTPTQPLPAIHSK